MLITCCTSSLKNVNIKFKLTILVSLGDYNVEWFIFLCHNAIFCEVSWIFKEWCIYWKWTTLTLQPLLWFFILWLHLKTHVSSNHKWMSKKRLKLVYQFHIVYKNQNETTLHIMQTNVGKLLILGRFKFNISRLVSKVSK